MSPQRVLQLWQRNHLRPFITALVACVALLALTWAFVAQQRALDAQRISNQVNHQQAVQNHRLAVLAQQEAQEVRDRLQFTADLLCGGFVPLSKITPPANISPIGTSLLVWAASGAKALSCPGRR